MCAQEMIKIARAQMTLDEHLHLAMVAFQMAVQVRPHKPPKSNIAQVRGQRLTHWHATLIGIEKNKKAH